jgi:mitogen-activated protein kinase kinase 1
LKGEAYYTDTDIWSIGLMLVECALGRFPYPDPEDQVQELGFWELMKYITMKPSPKLPDSFSDDFKDFV